jgi:glycosyltransferase involved in cell wall biosynthesis
VPLFFWVLDLWPESLAASGMMTSRHAARIAEAAARFAYRVSDVVLAPSKGYFSSIEKVAAKPVDIRYFPQWAGEPNAPAEPPDVGTLPAGFRAMFTGNIGDSQDFDTILAAAELTAAQADIHWIIVGDGRRLPWVRQEISRRNLGKTVHTPGRFPSQAMPPLMREADILFATLRDDPTFAVTIPAKIQSYLAAGKPLVTAINGEVTDLVREAQAGIAVAAGNPAALAAAVRAMYAMTAEERARLGGNALSFFNRSFARDRLIDQLVAWFQEEVAKRNRAMQG